VLTLSLLPRELEVWAMKNDRAPYPVESTRPVAVSAETTRDEVSDSYDASDEAPDVLADYEPPVGSMPRLYRGVIWSDVVAEIYAEREEREAA
jgi:hypothetical protein